MQCGAILWKTNAGIMRESSEYPAASVEDGEKIPDSIQERAGEMERSVRVPPQALTPDVCGHERRRRHAVSRRNCTEDIK